MVFLLRYVLLIRRWLWYFCYVLSCSSGCGYGIDAITSGMGGIHGIGTGILGLHLTQIIDLRIIYGDLPSAIRRLQQVILIIMGASEWVIWDAVYTSLLDPTNHR